MEKIHNLAKLKLLLKNLRYWGVTGTKNEILKNHYLTPKSGNPIFSPKVTLWYETLGESIIFGFSDDYFSQSGSLGNFGGHRGAQKKFSIFSNFFP